MTVVGFLGIGRMGGAVAGRLIGAGIKVRAWNRSDSSAVARLRAAGADVVATAAEALDAPISISMLADDRAAETVLSRVSIGSDREGRVHLNLASTSPSATALLARRFGEAGVSYVAAPVLGGSDAAGRGELDILVAGASDSLKTVEPLVRLFSSRTWEIGDQPRQASVAKAALNLMSLLVLDTVGETLALAEDEGVDPYKLGPLLGSKVLADAGANTLALIASRRHGAPGFPYELGPRDLPMIERLATGDGVDLSILPALRRRFLAALTDPRLCGLDWSAVARVAARGHAV